MKTKTFNAICVQNIKYLKNLVSVAISHVTRDNDAV